MDVDFAYQGLSPLATRRGPSGACSIPDQLQIPSPSDQRPWSDDSSLQSLYSMLSTKASQLALITFSWTPTVPQVLPSSSSAFDHDADGGGGAGLRIDHAHFVVDQLHAAEAGEVAVERFRNAASRAFTGPSPSATSCFGLRRRLVA